MYTIWWLFVSKAPYNTVSEFIFSMGGPSGNVVTVVLCLDAAHS